MLTRLKKLLATYTERETDNTEFEVYDTSGRKYRVVELYTDEDCVCIDIEREDQ